MSSENQELIKALHLQTQAINALVQSNQQVIALLTDVVGALIDDEAVLEDNQPRFLDGSLVSKAE